MGFFFLRFGFYFVFHRRICFFTGSRAKAGTPPRTRHTREFFFAGDGAAKIPESLLGLGWVLLSKETTPIAALNPDGEVRLAVSIFMLTTDTRTRSASNALR